ncbi:MAG: TrbI/VirB10 family protein [Spirochaetaceae bacterium]|nr:TrbI/VirB10 family protein [Spirochaetaceae bacterium]
MSDENQNEPEEPAKFLNPADETKNEMPGFFQRGKVLKIAVLVISVIAVFGLITNNMGSKKKNGKSGTENASNARPADFLIDERDRALQNMLRNDASPPVPDTLPRNSEEAVSNPGLPPYENNRYYPERAQNIQGNSGENRENAGNGYGAGNGTGGGTGGGNGYGGGYRESYPSDIQKNMAHLSPLIPQIEGSLFASKAPQTNYANNTQNPPSDPYASAQDYVNRLASLRNGSEGTMPQNYGTPPNQSAYQTQNGQSNKNQFYNGTGSGDTIRNGYFLNEDTLWTGTIIPGVLVTGINTDLPGDITARVINNVYDSKSGKHLLLPQGTLLVAKYNSSISYAQSRVQIIWNTLIRPDGFTLDLGGMNGVDAQGRSGQKGEYHENWFQYLKAAGIIAAFTIANSRLTSDAAKLGSDNTAASMAQANTGLVNQLGNNIINRALDIQPTITVDSGTPINIMLNKPVYLPPLDDYPVKQKYDLKK